MPDSNAPIPDNQFIPDDVTNEDPQTAAAVPGMQAIAKYALDSGPKTQDSIQPDYNSPIDFAGNAIGSRLGTAMAKDAGEVIGNEIGSFGKVVNDIKQSGKLLDANGVEIPIVNGKPVFGKVTLRDTPKQPVGTVKRILGNETGALGDQRLAQAKQMGFDTDTTYYHGTKDDIESFDPTKTKSTGGTTAGFFTKNPDIASGFATNGKGSNVIPVHLKTQDTFDYAVKDDVDSIPRSVLKEVGEDYKEDGRPMSPKDVRQEIEMGNWNFIEHPLIIKALKDQGFDSAHMFEEGQKNITVFDPSQIRSKFANFDPKQAKSGKLSYAQGGAIKMADGGIIADKDFVPDPEPQNQQINPSQSQIAQFHDPNEIGFNNLGAIPDSQFVPDDEKYSSPIEQTKTGLEGLAQGIAGPVAPLAEEAFMSTMGQSPEETAANIRGRAAANPVTSMGSEVGGLLAGAFIPGGQLKTASQIGSKAAEILGLGGKAASLASKIGAGAAEGAISNMLLSSGDEVTNMIKQQPGTSLQAAVSDVGLSAVLGGVAGGTLGAVEPLWNKVLGEKGKQLISDFKGEMAFQATNPEPLQAVTKELQDYFTDNMSQFDEVFGPKGLKAEEISKVMPKMSTAIQNQTTGILERLDGSLKKLANDQNLPLLEDAATKFKTAINNSGDSAEQIFNATQDLKQQLQEYAKYNKDIHPLAEKNFRSTAKDLAFGLRNDLEDSSIWGQAGKRQQSINKAFSEYLPALKDFQSKFTSKIAGEPVIDSGKVATYLNSVGKPNAEIKQEMLKNFIDASEKYRNVIADTHANLGLTNPLGSSSLSLVNRTLNTLTPGAKLAQILLKNHLGNFSGKSTAALAGASIGHLFGHAGIGALVGEHALGPFLSSILPAIGKMVLNNESNSVGLKAAAEYGSSVTKGFDLTKKASKNVFKYGADVLPSYVVPKTRDIERLDKRLQEIQDHPTQSVATATDLTHYMPDHTVAANKLAATASQYLNSLRPNAGRGAPLDTLRKPSSSDIADYRRQLVIAQQPLMILKNIKEGSLNSKDLMTIKTLYPDLYNHMTQTLINDLSTHMSKGHAIPYKTRLGLSLFAGQPLDSTMSPMSIISAQGNTTSAQPPQQSPQKKLTKGGADGLNKVSKMYSTPSQAAEEAQTKR